MTSSTIVPKKKTISFFEKYALAYYTPSILIMCYMALLEHYKTPYVFASIVAFVSLIGYYLPFKDARNSEFSKEINSSQWATYPLISSCLCTPLFLSYVWLRYDQLVFTNGDFIYMLLGTVYAIGGSIDASHELLHRN